MKMDSMKKQQIEEALANVLSDSKFAASPQMSAFLSYVVNETMAGNADRIKAYTVAVDALGKPTSFDPQNDPSVRVLANRLRASLEKYYTNNPEQALFIQLYRGSYVPHFIDASGQEHIENIKQRPQTTSNTILPPQYDSSNRVYAPIPSLQRESGTHHSSQAANSDSNRVSLWLTTKVKKYG